MILRSFFVFVKVFPATDMIDTHPTMFNSYLYPKKEIPVYGRYRQALIQNYLTEYEKHSCLLNFNLFLS